ncbi:MAG: thiamine phosphate synthase [Planctomycetota bacterium]|nr:thiamine phosphate synthase [Planctomycetota bacterium]
MFRTPVDLAAHLHTVFVTDGLGDIQRLDGLLEAALAGGIRVVQLREPKLDAAALSDIGRRWMPRFDAVGAALLVNDRTDVALAGRAHGVHLKQVSLATAPVGGENLWIGRSVHDAAEILAARAAHYLHLAPLFPTTSKPGVTPLGVEGARALLATTAQPVVLLGGITLDNVERARRIGGIGVAVMSAICGAADPESAARQLVASRRVATLSDRQMGAT